MKPKRPTSPAAARTASRPCTDAPAPTIAEAAAGPGRRRAELEAKHAADRQRNKGRRDAKTERKTEVVVAAAKKYAPALAVKADCFHTSMLLERMARAGDPAPSRKFVKRLLRDNADIRKAIEDEKAKRQG